MPATLGQVIDNWIRHSANQEIPNHGWAKRNGWPVSDQKSINIKSQWKGALKGIEGYEKLIDSNKSDKTKQRIIDYKYQFRGKGVTPDTLEEHVTALNKKSDKIDYDDFEEMKALIKAQQHVTKQYFDNNAREMIDFMINYVGDNRNLRSVSIVEFLQNADFEALKAGQEYQAPGQKTSEPETSKPPPKETTTPLWPNDQNHSTPIEASPGIPPKPAPKIEITDSDAANTAPPLKDAWDNAENSNQKTPAATTKNAAEQNTSDAPNATTSQDKSQEVEEKAATAAQEDKTPVVRQPETDSTHIVKSGDNIWNIVQELYDTDPDNPMSTIDIQKASQIIGDENGIKDIHKINADDRIKLPSPEQMKAMMGGYVVDLDTWVRGDKMVEAAAANDDVYNSNATMPKP